MELKNRKINLRTTSYCLRAKSGFTLIEILIVVSIIGLLASIIFVGFASARARGRDARRVADLRTIQTGLELYFTKNGKYPSTNEGTAALVGVGVGLGITRIPADPAGNVAYVYESNGNQYLIVASTEATAGDAIYTSSAQEADLTGFTNKGGCGVTKYCVSF